MRFVGAFALLLSTIACGGSRPAPASELAKPAPRIAKARGWLRPSMGATLADARKHDFFTFFQWTDRAREDRADGTAAVVFGASPTAREFLANDRLVVIVDRDDRVVSMELRLTAELLDGPNQLIALDVLKSFVTASAREPIDPDVALLSKVLYRPCERPNEAILPMRLVVGGQSDSATLERNGVRLLFTNTGSELVAKATPI